MNLCRHIPVPIMIRFRCLPRLYCGSLLLPVIVYCILCTPATLRMSRLSCITTLLRLWIISVVYHLFTPNTHPRHETLDDGLDGTPKKDVGWLMVTLVRCRREGSGMGSRLSRLNSNLRIQPIGFQSFMEFSQAIL